MVGAACHKAACAAGLLLVLLTEAPRGCQQLEAHQHCQRRNEPRPAALPKHPGQLLCVKVADARRRRRLAHQRAQVCDVQRRASELAIPGMALISAGERIRQLGMADTEWERCP